MLVAGQGIVRRGVAIYGVRRFSPGTHERVCVQHTRDLCGQIVITTTHADRPTRQIALGQHTSPLRGIFEAPLIRPADPSAKQTRLAFVLAQAAPAAYVRSRIPSGSVVPSPASPDAAWPPNTSAELRTRTPGWASVRRMLPVSQSGNRDRTACALPKTGHILCY